MLPIYVASDRKEILEEAMMTLPNAVVDRCGGSWMVGVLVGGW